MRILIDINHPSQVHLFKHAAWEWEAHGHNVLIVARDKDVTLELLREYGLTFLPGTKRKPGMLNLAAELFTKTASLVRISRDFRPDIFVSLGSPPAAWAATLLGKPHIAFTDTEHSKEQLYLYKPFSKRIYTPDCFLTDLGPKQIRYAGYHELAYLHPKRFRPNLHNLEKIGLSKNRPYFVIRFVSFNATHDINRKGLDEGDKKRLLDLLQRHGDVVVSSEAQKGMQILSTGETVPAKLMHDLLAFAALFIGEGTTMATEAALLGTPAITLTPHSGGNRLELENKYGLVKAIRDPEELMAQVQDFLANKELKAEWEKKRQKLLDDKIDVTEFIVREIETYSDVK
jgi:predicted glycosyltransferase